mmetsp:Transcript_6329/g.8578  ORF Transcript_6329/g.8578 Transcript_6329/m.8578 type:complete len:221 (+) Transcript_6329:70-732(+)
MAPSMQINVAALLFVSSIIIGDGFLVQTQLPQQRVTGNRILSHRAMSSKTFQLQMNAAEEGKEGKAPTEAGSEPASAVAQTDPAASAVAQAEPEPTPEPKRELDTFEKMGLPWWLNPNTKGGVLIVGALSLVFPYSIYYGLQYTGMEDVVAGQYVGVGFVLISCVLWTLTYVFRVATKDMTYAKQLKDYENAVLQKRLEELKEDEVQALIEEIEREDILN